MTDINIEELRLKCQKLDEEIRAEKMKLIEEIVTHCVFGVTRDTNYLDLLLIKRNTLKEIAKWY